MPLPEGYPLGSVAPIPPVGKKRSLPHHGAGRREGYCHPARKSSRQPALPVPVCQVRAAEQQSIESPFRKLRAPGAATVRKISAAFVFHVGLDNLLKAGLCPETECLRARSV